MKRRVAKKFAKNFILGKKTFPLRDETHILDTDGNWCIDTVAVMPEPVLRQVCAHLRRFGWGTCFGGAPDVIRQTFPDGTTIPGAVEHIRRCT